MRSRLLILYIFSTLAINAQVGLKGFSVNLVPDSIWNRMQGKSYQPNNYIKRKDLRYLEVLHYDYDGLSHRGQLVCNELIAHKLILIFQELYRQQYPIQRIRLADEYGADDELQMRDNNTSCFCYRAVSGTQRLSYHARGLAIDINPLYNPYVRKLSNGKYKIQPSTATPYVDRSKPFRYKIVQGDLLYRLFIQHGFTWGGSWHTLKDFQHFEYRK